MILAVVAGQRELRRNTWTVSFPQKSDETVTWEVRCISIPDIGQMHSFIFTGNAIFDVECKTARHSFPITFHHGCLDRQPWMILVVNFSVRISTGLVGRNDSF